MLPLLNIARFFSRRAYQEKYNQSHCKQLNKRIQIAHSLLSELKQGNRSKRTRKVLLSIRQYKSHPEIRSLRKRILKEVSKQKKQQKREIEIKVQEFENLMNQLIGELK